MNKRYKSGQGMVELAAGTLFIIPIVLLLIDCSILVFGITCGDNICRDAARSASVGDPAQAAKRAQIVINQANLTKLPIIKTYTLTSAVASNVNYPAATTGGVVQGSIAVDTSVTIIPPFLLKFIAKGASFAFSSHQNFPVTYTLQQTIQPN